MARHPTSDNANRAVADCRVRGAVPGDIALFRADSGRRFLPLPVGWQSRCERLESVPLQSAASRRCRSRRDGFAPSLPRRCGGRIRPHPVAREPSSPADGVPALGPGCVRPRRDAGPGQSGGLTGRVPVAGSRDRGRAGRTVAPPPTSGWLGRDLRLVAARHQGNGQLHTLRRPADATRHAGSVGGSQWTVPTGPRRTRARHPGEALSGSPRAAVYGLYVAPTRGARRGRRVGAGVPSRRGRVSSVRRGGRRAVARAGHVCGGMADE